MKKLIVRPLAESAVSTVIVIDALDECKDEEPASAILSVLGQFVTEVRNVKFFITGRPESRIREGFFFFFFFFWVLVYCAKAVHAYVTHYYTMRRGAKRGSSILIRVGSDVYPSTRPCLVGLSTNPSSTSTTSAIPYLFSSSVVGLFVLRIGRSIH